MTKWICGLAIAVSFPMNALLAQSEGAAQNLARFGTPKSWLANSVSSHELLLRAVDGDPLTFWASNKPTNSPPKDIGVAWKKPRRFRCVRVKFFSLSYVPARGGWRMEARVNGAWKKLDARVENPDCPWWTFSFAPVTASAIRLVVTKYVQSRPAVSEFEVYASAPPRHFRRPPVLDGAFWAFQYENWASFFKTDETLAAQLDPAHKLGMNIVILYTLNGKEGRFSTVVPDTVLPQTPAWKGRDPVEAILSRADELGMQVFLGDATPHGFLGRPDAKSGKAIEAKLYKYREQLLSRYAKHNSLVGYYINFECCPDRFDNDPSFPSEQSEKLAAFVKSRLPRLRVIQPIGFYRWRDSKKSRWNYLTPDKLESFWGPFMKKAKHVDIMLPIDGVGTGLAPLNFTDANQKRVRALCDKFGKEMWTDVECADFRHYTPMPIGRFKASLEVAAQYADRIVTFCYLNYMCPGNGRESSRRLYEEYEDYLRRITR